MSVMDIKRVFSVVVCFVFFSQRTEPYNRATDRNAGNSLAEFLSNLCQHVCCNRNPRVRNYPVQRDRSGRNNQAS